VISLIVSALDDDRSYYAPSSRSGRGRGGLR